MKNWYDSSKSLWAYMHTLVERKKAFSKKVSFTPDEDMKKAYDIDVTGSVIYVESMEQYVVVTAQELMDIMSHWDFNKLYLDFEQSGYKLYSVEDSAHGLCHGIAVRIKSKGGD